jgi:hypothetical protein
MRQLEHLVQDLRANAHRAPEDLRSMIRQAALELERVANLVLIDGEIVLPAPFPPPTDQETHPCA